MGLPEKSPFLLGVNYPWRKYGEDFGEVDGKHAGISSPDAQKEIVREFEQIRETGISVVRWFLFGDGRGGFHADKGIARKPDKFLLADVNALLQLALQNDLKICFSLIDYLWLQEHAGKRAPHSHEHVLHFAAGREAFLQNVLIPLFREFRAHPGLFAWEIANEPEWAIHEFHRDAAAKMHLADFRAYAYEIAQAAHESAETPVTLGSARLLWVRAWTELGLDYYQAHFYPAAEKETRKGLAQQLAALPALKRPLWIGELPARDPDNPQYTLANALEICRAAGLCGAAAWRWTQPEAQGTDVALGRVDPAELLAWSKKEKSEGTSA
jgi:hypothetical protein